MSRHNLGASLIQLGKNGNLMLRVFVKPGARECQVTAVDEAVHVRIAAPPRDGEANQRLTEFLAEVIGTKARNITVVHGHKSREKTVSIENVDAQQIESSIKA